MNRKDHHHLNLLCDIGELAALLAGSENIETFLQRTVEMVARHMNANVCSIYLHDETSNQLILKATVGLNPEAIGKIRLKIGEGLVGTTLEKLKPVKEGLAGRNHRFKYLSEACEDSFDSFLAVPVQRGAEKIGVLVVRHQEQDYFDDIDVMAMRAISSQLAGAIGNARLLMEQNQQRAQKNATYQILPRLRMIEGQVASPGYAFAPATIFDKSHGASACVEIDPETIHSLSDFDQAVQSTADQLNELQCRFAQRLPESASLIFTAHLMILKDLRFAGEMEKLVESGIPPPVAIKKVAEHYVELYSASAHAHIREIAHDVRDLAGRILRNLTHDIEEDPFLSENRIVIAPELYPSDVLKLASEDIKGIILVSGGITAHVCILARSLQIPMIIATEPDLLNLPEGTPIILDAENGSIYIQPSDELIDEFESAKQVKLESEISAEQLSPFTLTKDGIKIRLLANINLLTDLRLARKFKAEGVGLYRTEFPFLIRSALPSEEEQYLIYKRLFDEMDGKDVTIRTLDLGGDKLLAYSDTKGETNPDLGLRAIRFSFRHRDIFHQQLRAILRAGAESENIRIMFPMISSLDEFGQAKEAVFDAINELENKKLPHHQHPLIGALLEIPSVVEIIDELAAAADFLSIGTNDFIQYMLAVDRSNEAVAAYYCPYHPSVLRGLSKIAQAAARRNKDLSICGEMAHQMEYIPFLLGIGIRILSVYPKFLPSVQKAINGFTMDDVNLYAGRLLSETTLKGIRNILKAFNKDAYLR